MKLSNTIFKSIFLVSLITAFLAFTISIFLQYNSFTKDTQHIKEVYLKDKKNKIRKEVISLLNEIDTQKNAIEKNIKLDLKKQVNQVYNIAKNIYEENKNTLDEKQIKLLIVTTLKNIPDNNKNITVFIKDTKGESIFEKNSFTNEKKSSRKLSHIKSFESFNWNIGASEFIEDEIEKVKNEILNKIAVTRFSINEYIFVNTWDGYSLVFDGNRVPTPIYWGDDEIFKEEKKAASHEMGSFFIYKFKKITSTETFPKVSFVKRYEPWNWIVGTGVYLDEIDTEIARKEVVFKQTIYNQIESLLFIILISALFIYLISKTISSYIDTNIKHLINSFKSASKDSLPIDTRKLTYVEFISLARKLNNILKDKHETQIKLERYIKIVNDNVLITSTDRKGIITKASEAFCKLSGYTQDDLINNSFKIMRDQTVSKEFYRKLWKDLKKGISWTGEIKNKDIHGQTFWIETIIHPEYKNDELIGYTAIKQDITDKKRIEQLSIVDELTGLYNRRSFNLKVNEELNRAKREERSISFMMLDIDYFKNYNDTYGHHAGDEALIRVAEALKIATKRESDFAFRLGGEEFCIIFSPQEDDDSLEFANLIRQNIENLNIEHKTSKVKNVLTISIGLVIKKHFEISDTNTLYQETDEALYKAKAQGRNKVCLNQS